LLSVPAKWAKLYHLIKKWDQSFRGDRTALTLTFVSQRTYRLQKVKRSSKSSAKGTESINHIDNLNVKKMLCPRRMTLEFQKTSQTIDMSMYAHTHKKIEVC
jgi:hypothetical protein